MAWPASVGGGAGYFRGGGAAGAAPVGPEVDEDGNAGVLDDVVEEFGVGLEGLVERREGVFAGSATAGVGEVLGSNAVLLAAVFAGCDDGHLVCLRLVIDACGREFDAGWATRGGGSGWRTRSRVWREEFGYEAEAFGEGLRGEERVLALAQLGVVEVDCERELVDGDGVGEGGFDVVGLGFFVDAGFAVDSVGLVAGDEGEAAALPGVLAGLAADVGDGLGPDEVGEGGGDAGGVDEGVADVDEELEGEGEAVAEEAGGDEDAVVVAEGDVAVADGLVAELGGVGGGDHGGVGVAVVARRRSVECGDRTHGERDEVVDLAAEGSGDGGGDGLDHAGEIVRGEAGVAEGGVADAVGGLCMIASRATWVALMSPVCTLSAIKRYSNWYEADVW